MGKKEEGGIVWDYFVKLLKWLMLKKVIAEEREYDNNIKTEETKNIP